MVEKMTLEQVRDWHRKNEIYLNGLRIETGNNTDKPNFHRVMADAIDAHLATPAQAVDIEAVREVILQLRAYQKLHNKWPQAFPDMELDSEADKLSQAIGDKT